jgi:peptide/nickel transport system ATP-binding protein
MITSGSFAMAIAMALLPEPDLIVADEPTTALDVTIQAQILRLLYRLVGERGVSLLFTTHDLGTAYEICNRITVMYAGQEVESAPTAAFFRAPRHPYTGKLLESLPNPEGDIRDIPGEIPGLIEDLYCALLLCSGRSGACRDAGQSVLCLCRNRVAG